MVDLAVELSHLVSRGSTSRNHSTPSRRAELFRLRELILLRGLPDGPEGTELRPVVWKLLLHLHHVPPASEVHPLLDADTYHHLVARDPSPMFHKIRNDTFRTLATDPEFVDKVGEDKLVRLLEAFVYRQVDAQRDGRPSPVDPAVPYVQGLNVLAAPFLYVLPSELEAWACFTTFIESQAPRYVRPTLVGVHDGLQLVDECLVALDPDLHRHLARANLSAELYAFASILTCSAATRPLGQVLELWDFLLSFGIGLNVLAVVAQLVLARDDILASQTPMKLLRTFPPLNAREVIPLVVQFVGDLGETLYDHVVRHPWDDDWRTGTKYGDE